MTRPNPKTLKTRTGKHGGARAHAGRKRKEGEKIRKTLDDLVSEIVAHMATEGWVKEASDFAMALHIHIMRDPRRTLKVRMYAANWVWEHLIGKPKQEQEIKSNINMTVEARVERYRAIVEKVYGRDTAAGSGGDPASGRESGQSGDAARPA